MALLEQIKKERDPMIYNAKLWFESPPQPSPREIALAEERQRFLLARLQRDMRSFLQAEARLRVCVYLAVSCALCGDLRMAQVTAPRTETVGCPVCHERLAFTVLGAGATRRPLPFHEFFRGQSIDADGRNRIPWDEMYRVVREE